MATNTYVAIETKTLTSAVSTVTLGAGNTIPQTYTDLVIVFNGSMTTLDNNNIRFNGVSTGSLYSVTRLIGNGSSASSSRASNQNQMQLGEIATSQSTDVIQIMNYSNSTTFKTVLARSANTAQMLKHNVGLFRSTSPITMIEIFSGGGYNYPVGSTFTLYGIASSNIGAPKAFGGTITQDANYTYHTFGASGTFTPQQSLTADILVVAGGGGGAGRRGGGGGAGGLLAFTSQSLSATNYTCTIGAGGSGGSGGTGNTPATFGTQGGTSQFGGLTASVGGGFATGDGSGTAAGNGGSGGGSGGSGAAGTATSGQGFNGGTSGNNAPNYGAGGGGGSGGAGANGTTTVGGAGGIGTNAYSSWLTTTGSGVSGYIAAGGGGGTYQGGTSGSGGLGGGGNAGTSGTDNSGAAGLVNTGSGGGGGSIQADSSNRAGGAGGSGVVIIRYANQGEIDAS